MGCSKTEQKNGVKASRPGRSGQALMEFVLGIMVVISFFVFFIKLSATFVIGNYIHYATFMAARAYMSSTQTLGDQQSNAEKVLRQMVGGRWKAMIKPDEDSSGSVPGGYVGPGPYAQENQVAHFWNQGVTYGFSSKLSIYPWSREGQSVELKLKSESWMPREQTVEECMQTKVKVAGSISQAGLNDAVVEWDENGC